MLPVWVFIAIAALLVATTLEGRHEWRRRNEAARFVKAIEAEDAEELFTLLREGTNFNTVKEWFGEPALIIAAKSSGSDKSSFACAAVRLFVTHGANVNEAGTLWKTALMHAAAVGNWDLCISLLSHGAEVAPKDIAGRTAADWAHREGYDRIAYFLGKV